MLVDFNTLPEDIPCLDLPSQPLVLLTVNLDEVQHLN